MKKLLAAIVLGAGLIEQIGLLVWFGLTPVAPGDCMGPGIKALALFLFCVAGFWNLSGGLALFCLLRFLNLRLSVDSAMLAAAVTLALAPVLFCLHAWVTSAANPFVLFAPYPLVLVTFLIRARVLVLRGA